MAGSGLAIAAAIGGCGGGRGATVERPITAEQRARNVEILNSLLDIEHEAIAAYSAGIPLLSGHARRAAKVFLGDELAHVSELMQLIRRQHGRPNRPRDSYDLGSPRTPAEVLQLFRRLERAQIGGYLDAIPQVQPGGMRSALAAILGSDAQHVAVLREALGGSPLEAAFVTGTNQ